MPIPQLFHCSSEHFDKQGCAWTTGPMPPKADKAFRELGTFLVLKHFVHYPQLELTYILIMNVCQGDARSQGVLDHPSSGQTRW